MAKLLKIFLIVFLLISCLFWLGWSQAENLEGNHLIQWIENADLIVEGILLKQERGVDRKVEGYVGPSKEMVYLNFGKAVKSKIQITRTFKGKENTGQILRIFVVPAETLSGEFLPDEKYILFLKQRKLKDGYTLLDQGRAGWMIFDYNGTAKIKPWNLDPMVRPAEAYENYTDFIRRVENSLSANEF